MQDPERKASQRLSSYLALAFLFYLILPILLVKYLHVSIGLILLFYLVCLFVVTFILKSNSEQKIRLEYRIEELQEKSNILSDQNSQEERNTLAFRTKINRYNSLKEIIERINRDFDLDAVADSLTSIANSVISDNKSSCLLYLIDTKNQRFNLLKTKKENENMVIKAKEGDIFDYWVMRHLNPLHVEDMKKDFRFDLEKLKIQDMRPIGSLISAPFMSEQRFIGLMRLDSPDPHSFSQDDLRLLVTICDIGAVALENSELFKKTQDLAIHDGLTQLYTKGYFMERLKEECKRSIRQATPFSLLMLDLDNFKNYNDQFGHTAGDLVLQRLSVNLTECLKESNAVASRFGGEEFCVILDGIDKKKALILANAIRERVEREKLVLRRQETHITVSIGVAEFPTDAIDDNELILKADKAMYEAKQKGRNRVVSA